MGKIRITHVNDETFKHKGFDERGCYNSGCSDACCRMGADVDRESYGIIMNYREKIEKRLKRKLDSCFESDWSDNNDFLGENSIATTYFNGFCALHQTESKGCVLFSMILEEGAPKRILPSTCRLYPITWQDGEIKIFNGIESQCNCLSTDNRSEKSIWDTQSDAIDDIFELV